MKNFTNKILDVVKKVLDCFSRFSTRKKVVVFCIVVVFLCFGIVGAVSCVSNNINHNVILILMEKDGTSTQKKLTKRSSGDTIYAPSDYKIYPSLIEGFVVVDDCWYLTEERTNTIYFPYSMPSHKLTLYANVRPLTKIEDLKFSDSNNVHDYFSSNSELQDEFSSKPNINSETSYYEICEKSVSSIKNIVRYYPATKSVVLKRGYSISENMGNEALVSDEFTINVIIDLEHETITCKGIYSRMGFSKNSSVGGSVNILYNVAQISIDDIEQPLFPNFSTVDYTYDISSATNSKKMQELWNADGYDYAKKCYAQVNTLLKTMNQRVIVLS